MMKQTGILHAKRLIKLPQGLNNLIFIIYVPGVSSLGVPGVPWHTQILADQLILFQPGGTDDAHLIITGTPGFSDPPTALRAPRTMHTFMNCNFL